MSDNNEALDILYKILDKLQRNVKVRRTLAVLLITGLLSVTAYFVYDLMPKEYYMTISGGGILTNRHHLVKVLQSEAEKNHIYLQIEPGSGSVELLNAVSNKKLDIALIQGGLEKKVPNVDHVAMLPPETLHILVKPEIKSIADLKGKIINLGTAGGGTRIISKKLLSFFGLNEYTDYIEANYNDDEIMNMTPDSLPDAIFTISYMPSYLADYLIREQGFQLLSIPSSDALSMRYVWAEKVDIPAGIYKENPPVPAEETSTIGIKLEIVARSDAPSDAIKKFLESLYSSSAENVILQKIEEETGDSLSNYPLSSGTVAYMKRNEPFFSMELVDNIKNIFGSIMAFLSTVLIIIKWFKGNREEEKEESEPSEEQESKEVQEQEEKINT
jgi:TRAP transporter TAXI family solute receptor